MNWAAQAFDLNSTCTWLVTFILVVAPIVAMLGIELIRSRSRRRRAFALFATTTTTT